MAFIKPRSKVQVLPPAPQGHFRKHSRGDHSLFSWSHNISEAFLWISSVYSNVLSYTYGMPMHRELNQDFFKKWSPEMAYVLGFFAADGSMVCNKRGAHFIEFTIVDRIVLEQIQKAVGSTHKIQKRGRRSSAHQIQYRIQIGSKEWFEDLSCLGFMQNKSKRLSLPNVTIEYFGDFVRGYFDGDGCVYFNRRLQFADRKKPRAILMTLFTS